MTGWTSYWRRTGDGLAIRVRLTPGSSREMFEGIGRDADGEVYVKARVRAAPEAGKANKALVELMARRIGCRKSDIEIASGTTSRIKTLLVRQSGVEDAVAGLAD